MIESLMIWLFVGNVAEVDIDSEGDEKQCKHLHFYAQKGDSFECFVLWWKYKNRLCKVSGQWIAKGFNCWFSLFSIFPPFLCQIARMCAWYGSQVMTYAHAAAHCLIITIRSKLHSIDWHANKVKWKIEMFIGCETLRLAAECWIRPNSIMFIGRCS